VFKVLKNVVTCLKLFFLNLYWDKKKQYCGSGILDLGAFLTPGFRIWDPGWVKNQDPDPRSVMNNPDHISESLETIIFG
jgi:hypothetical protein